MFECNTSDEEKPDFAPFTLNIRLTTRKSAANLYKLLQPIIYSRPHGVPTDTTLTDINREQRQMAEDVCNMLSDQVNDIAGE